MQVANVLDKAFEVLERPDPAKAERIAAEQRRAEMRAETARRIEENRLSNERREREMADAKKRADEAAMQKADSWENHFKPYCLPHREATLNTVTKQLIARLLNFGNLRDVRAECATRVSPLLDAWDVAFEAKGKATRAEFKRQFNADIEENAERLREGISELRPLVQADPYEKHFTITRSICRDRMLEVSKQINPVLLELADKLQHAARRLCNERLVSEKSEADSFNIPFEPSGSLRFLITAGLDFRGTVERNFLSSQLCCPRTTLYGLLDPNTKW
jgi:hypothetical protein